MVGLRDRPADGQGDLDARGQALELPDGARGRTSSGSTTPACIRRDPERVRRRLRSARRRPNPRPRCSTLDTGDHDRHAGAALHHSPPLLAGAMGSAQLPAQRRHVRRLGHQPVSSPSTRRAGARSSTAASRSRCTRTGPTASRGPASRDAALAGRLAPQSNGSVKVYASWNGATQVHSWRVLAGLDRAH